MLGGRSVSSALASLPAAACRRPPIACLVLRRHRSVTDSKPARRVSSNEPAHARTRASSICGHGLAQSRLRAAPLPRIDSPDLDGLIPTTNDQSKHSLFELARSERGKHVKNKFMAVTSLLRHLIRKRWLPPDPPSNSAHNHTNSFSPTLTRSPASHRKRQSPWKLQKLK
jgi:hypothetical protein